MSNDDYRGKHEADEEEPVIGDPPPSARVFLSNGVYDALKFLALVLLPATGALYFGLAGIWGLPNAQEVVGTVVVVDTFLGVVLGISNSKYKASDARFDGTLNVHPEDDEGRRVFQLELEEPPESLATKDKVEFKVNKVSGTPPLTPGDLPPVHPMD